MTIVASIWYRQSPAQRFALLMLILILCANIVLSEWFSSRTRETSVDEIVQKAYVVSRMISDAAVRSLASGEMSNLDTATNEALNDRDLISITVRDRKGKVVLEKTKDNPPARFNTFQTPVRRDGRVIGTVITHFSTTGEDERLISRQRHATVVQWGLFAFIAAVLLVVWLWEIRSRGAASKSVDETACPVTNDVEVNTVSLPFISPSLPFSGNQLAEYSAVPACAPVEPPAEDEVLPDCPRLLEHHVPPRDSCPDVVPSPTVQSSPLPSLARDLCGASNALQEVLSVLSADENMRRQGTEHARLFGERVGRLQRQAAEVASRADKLIATGSGIVESVMGQCETPAASGDIQAGEAQSLAQRVSDSSVSMREALDAVRSAGAEMRLLAVPGSAPHGLHDTMTAAVGMAEESSAVMRERVLPALAAARDDEHAVTERVASLVLLLEDLDGRAHAIARGSEVMNELATTARSLGCADGRAPDGREYGLLAERMLEFAGSMAGDISALRALAGKAVAVGGSVDEAAGMARSMVGWAGSAVEDSAAASIMEGELLRRSLSLSAEGDAYADRVIREIAGLAECLRETQSSLDVHLTLVKELVDHISALTGAMEQQQLQTQEYTGSLAVAGGTLRLAGTFLAELVAEGAQLAEISREAAYLAGGTQGGEEGGLEELVRQAHERITHILISSGEGDEGMPEPNSEQ